MQPTIVSAYVWATGIGPIYSSHTVISFAIDKLFNVACISALIIHDTLVSRFSYATRYTTQHF